MGRKRQYHYQSYTNNENVTPSCSDYSSNSMGDTRALTYKHGHCRCERFDLSVISTILTHVVVLAAFAFCFFKLVEVCDTALSKLGEKQKDHTPTSPTTNKNSTKYPSRICTPKPAYHLVLTVSTR